VSSGGGFEGDAVAEGLELGDCALPDPIGVASDKVVAAKVSIVTVPPSPPSLQRGGEARRCRAHGMIEVVDGWYTRDAHRLFATGAVGV
jgi:hypothetical protein